MSESIEITYAKFIFCVKNDCRYWKNGFWARIGRRMAMVGVTDFKQKTMRAA